MKTLTLTIEGMSCGHCVASVRKALENVEGVDVTDVGIGNAIVAVDDGTDVAAARSRMAKAVADAGYRLVSGEAG